MYRFYQYDPIVNNKLRWYGDGLMVMYVDMKGISASIEISDLIQLRE
jgi:hypothetical protein